MFIVTEYAALIGKGLVGEIRGGHPEILIRFVN